MSTWARTLVAAAAGAALVGVSACGPGGLAGGTSGEQTSAPPSKPAGLEKVDPCAMLTPEILAKFGLKGPGEPETMISDEPGCGYEGETYTAAVYKNQTKTVESYRTSNDWGQYKLIDINGRKAAEAIGAGATNADTCTSIMDAGGGVVLVNVTSYGREPMQPCAESTEIMRAMEPDLPK